MTKKDLATALELSPRALANYEDGENSPSESTVQKISFILGFPPSFFVSSEIDELDPQGVSFRSMRSLTATQRERTLACGKLASGIISKRFEAMFSLPQEDVPDLSGESPQVAAEILRAQWKLGNGPIDNMVHLLESKGVEVFWVNEASRCLDAVSFWRDGKPFVVMNIGMNSGDRSRLDAAHELAHLVLHRDAEDLDCRRIESEANQFAASFLMPREQFREECPSQPSLESFFRLKRRWKVSIQAMIRQGYEVGRYTKWHYECACKDVARRGWRTQEPTELAIPPERSRIHEIVFERLAEKGVSLSDFSHELHLPAKVIVELTPLAKGLTVGEAEVEPVPTLLKLEFWNPDVAERSASTREPKSDEGRLRRSW